MSNYVTEQGDTFDIIAYNAYGNEEYAEELIAANEEYAETAVFDYGTELELPEIENTGAAAAEPPWRQ